MKIAEKMLLQVGAHQESVLSPLLFTIVVEAIVENVKKN